MAERALVLGTGPDGLRAAAALAAAGHAVTLLQACETESGVDHPELPIDTGRMRVPPGMRPRVEAVIGAMVDAPDPMRGVTCGGRTRFLPLARHDVGLLFEPTVAAVALRAWVSARTRNRMSLLLGGGQEERTYRDWVERRMGGPAYHHLYRAYAEHRFGAHCEELAASVARVHHAVRDDTQHTVAGGGADQALAFAAGVIRAHGGDIQTGVQIESLVVDKVGKEDRVVAVKTSAGDVPVEGKLWSARSPAKVASWLGETLTPALQHDASTLCTRDALQVAVRGETDGLPEELHVLDEGAPFYRVVCPYGTEKTAIFHTLIDPQAQTPPDGEILQRFVASARAMGIGEFEGPPRVNRVREWLPVWTQTAHARLRRVVLAFDALGIVGVGRAGAFGLLDPGEELHLVLSMIGDGAIDQHEAHRALVDPPVLVDDLFCSITHFLER